MTPQEQANNAIRWIDTLPSYKQTEMASRMSLGGELIGYCCLGAGVCELFDTKDPYTIKDPYAEFKALVGLVTTMGDFKDGHRYLQWDNLVSVNDRTQAGFKLISKLLRTHPDWMFKPEVAELIKQHYSEQS